MVDVSAFSNCHSSLLWPLPLIPHLLVCIPVLRLWHVNVLERYWPADFPASEFKEEMSELDFAAVLSYILQMCLFSLVLKPIH